MNRTLPVSIAFALWSGIAHADAFTDAVIEKYQEMGFDFIEVKDGINQVKVEAIKDGQKIEVIYDRETGRILKQETERPDADDIGRSGVDISQENKDFLDDEDDDESDDDEDDESDDDEDDNESDDEDDNESDDDEDDNESDDDENDNGSNDDEGGDNDESDDED